MSWRIEFGARARTLVKTFGAALVAAGMIAAAPKPADANPKYAAIVVDTTTGNVLYEANADAKRYPASLTKMMTLYVLFEDLERGRFSLGSKFKVSANAAGQAPSKLGLRAGQTITAEEAIKALVTKSANDAAAVIAENLAGSVSAFAERMTRTARAIGMDRTVFKNPHGLPNGGQYTTARDMMKLGVALQVRFPQYYSYFSTRSFTFRGRTMGNHNRLLGRVEGVDGIKTGYINASGFNLVSSVKRDGRKIVAVVMGGKSAGSRDAHMRELIAAYLPKAKRGKGYDEDLVAAVRNAPKVAGGTKLIAEIPAALKNHPRPLPRPALEEVQVASVDPAEVTPAEVPMPPAPVPVAVAAAPVPPAPVPVAEPEITTASVTSSRIDPNGERVVRSLTFPVGSAYAPDAPPSDGGDAIAAMIAARIDGVPFEAASTFDPPEQGDAAMPEVAEAAPAPAPAAPPRASDVPKAAISGWLIQIGAVDSEEAANRLLDKARSKGGKALADAEPMTETFEKGSQTFVRARFAGFDSQKAAQRACAALKKNEFACFALRL